MNTRLTAILFVLCNLMYVIAGTTILAQDCPDLSFPPGENGVIRICTGTSVDLSVELSGSNVDPSDIIWSTGQTGLTVNTGDLINTGTCDNTGSQFAFTAFVPAQDGCPAADLLYVIIVIAEDLSNFGPGFPFNPVPTVSTSEDGCTVMVDACSSLLVQHSVNGGPLLDGTSYTADPDYLETETATVEFFLTNPCGIINHPPLVGTIDCTGTDFECPALDAEDRTISICSGDNATLNVTLTGDADPSDVVWSDGTTGLSFNTGTLTNTSDCSGLVEEFTASVPSGTLADCPMVSVTFTVTVQADPATGVAVSESPDGCRVSLAGACSGTTVQYSVNGAPAQSGSTYVASPAIGTTEVAAVSFTVTNSCGTATGFVGNINCEGGDCPTITPVESDITVCSGERATLQVNLSGDASPSDVTWSTGSSGTSLVTDVLTNETSCSGATQTFTASLDAVGGCPAQTLQYRVTVLPDPGVGAVVADSGDGCIASLIGNCPGTTVQYSLNNGPFQSGSTYVANPGLNETETASVRFIINSECGDSEILTGAINCEGPQCPQLTAVDPSITICSGESASLQVILSGDATSSDVEWSTGVVGTSFSTGSLTNTSGCDPRILTYTATVPANTVASCPQESVTFTVTVLPSPSNGATVTASDSGCSVTLEGACPGVSVQYSVNGGGLQTGNTYVADPDAGETEVAAVSFTLSSDCGSTSGFTGTINCEGAECPQLAPAVPNITVCSGESVTLETILTGSVPASGIVWSTGSTGLTASTGILTNTSGCDNELFTYTARIPANTFGSCPEVTASFTVSVRPDPGNGVTVSSSDDNCIVTLAGACPGSTVQYSVNGGSTQTGNVYIANPEINENEVAEVIFTVSNSTCGSATFSGDINCEGVKCPLLSPPPGVVTEFNICSGDEVDLEVIVENALPEDVVWSNGTTGLTLNTGVLTNISECDGTQFVFSACVPSDVEPGCPKVTVIYILTVLPDPSGVVSQVIENGCSVTMFTCPQFDVQYSVDNGPLQDGNIYVATPPAGQSENSQVDFVVTSQCDVVDFSGNIDCEAAQCPELAPVPPVNVTVCSGESATLEVALSGSATADDIVWSNGETGLSINTGSLANLTDCEGQTQTFSATIPASGDCEQTSVNFTVTILPDPMALSTISEGGSGCIVSVETCPDFAVEYSVNGAASESGNVYIASPTAGSTEVAAVSFTISSDCSSAELVGDINCRGAECPTISAVNPEVSVCGGETVRLEAVIGGDASDSDVSWSNDAEGTSINLTTPNNNTCDPFTVIYTASIAGNVVDGCDAVSTSFVVTILPTPSSDLVEVEVSDDGCSISAATCPDFTLQYTVDGGSLQNGNSYDLTAGAGQTTTAEVNFVISNDCGSASVSNTISCQGEGCPEISANNTNLQVCSGESLDLSVNLIGSNDPSIVQWSTGSTGTSINTGALDNINSCDPIEINYTAFIADDSSNCPDSEVVFTVSVLPAPSALANVLTLQENCIVTVETCPDFTVMYNLDGGQSFEGDTYVSDPQPGEKELVTINFTISNSCGIYAELSGEIDCINDKPLDLVVESTRDCSTVNDAGDEYLVSVVISGGDLPYEVTGTVDTVFNDFPEDGNSVFFTFGVPNGDGYYLFIETGDGQTEEVDQLNIVPCEILDIELIAFNGETTAEGNLLKWVTANEMNNDYFTLYHSTNGIDFTEIGTVEGADNSTNTLTYSFLHKNAPTGLSYYYLAQTDFDGTTTQPSNIITLERGEYNFGITHVGVIQDAVTIHFTNENATAVNATLYDVMGRKVHQHNFNANIGQNTLQMDVHYFPKGIYFIALDNGREVITQKILK